jgi:formyl-CoA transferase
MENYARKQEVIAAFFRRYTKAELIETARAHNLLIAPLATIEDVRQNPQFIARDYWQTVPHPSGRALTYPGPFARLTGKPITFRRRAPKVGEHNQEVLGNQLGLPAGQIADLTRRGII